MKLHIDLNNLPRHIAVMMDGNGRWAQRKGYPRIFGHKNAKKSIQEVIEGTGDLGIPYLTLWVWSKENWARPKEEVEALMQLLADTIDQEQERLTKAGVKLTVIGDMESLPKRCQEKLQKVVTLTRNNQKLHLNLAISYSGRWDIVEAVKAVAEDIKKDIITPSDIDEVSFKNYLKTKELPDPDLLIRTGGELRLSNFLLWQMAYTEIFITDVLWPDFRKRELYAAILNYQQRERRFGKTSEQLNQL